MSQNNKIILHYSKNASIPDQDDIEFIYGLGHQHSDESLVNYIASNFNNVKGLHCRKIKVSDWINALKWLIVREELYDEYLLPFFHDRIFKDTLNHSYQYHDKLYKIENFNRTVELLEHLENYEDIQTIGDGTFQRFMIPEYSDVTVYAGYNEMLRESHENDFSSFGAKEQEFILSLYRSYLRTREEFNTGEYGFCHDEIIDKDILYDVTMEEIEKRYDTTENATIVSSIWKHFNSLKKFPNVIISDDDIKQYIEQEMHVDTNMILTSYYLQYIILSIQALKTADKTSFGIVKFSGSQADIMQRLLCAVTSKNWDKLKQKSNSYYKTINNMFKIDTTDKYEIDGLTDQLCKVKDLLTQGGFEDAIKLINSDIEKIRNLKI